MVMVHYRDRPVLSKVPIKCWGETHTQKEVLSQLNRYKASISLP